MKIIDRYIIKQLLIGFLLAAFGMTAIIWLSQSLRMIDWIVNKGVSVGLFMELTLLVLPNFVAVITPLAFFIVLLFTYQRLLSDRELIVMKAAGMSPWHLAKPAFMLGIGLVIVGYALTLWFVPTSVTRFKDLQFKIRNDLAHVAITEGEFNVLPNNMTVYVRVFEQSGHLEGILIQDTRDPKKRVLMVAEDGYFLTSDGDARIVMRNGKRQEYDRQNKIFSSLSFETYTMVLEDAKKEGRIRTAGEEEQSLISLLGVQRSDPGVSPGKYREYKVEAFKRLSQPLYTFVYLVIGLLPFLLGYYNRRGQSGRIYLAIACVVLIQASSLGFERLSNKDLNYLFLMSANILVPLIFCLWILRRGRFLSWPKWGKKIGLVIGLILISQVAFSADRPQFIKDTTVDQSAPAYFEAGAFSYNEKTQIVTASGDVVITQAGTTLKADQLTYDRQKDYLKASGHVHMTRPDGVELNADEAELTSDLKKGVLHAIEMRLADGSIFRASSVVRKNEGNDMRLRDVFFTPCNVCADCDPLWNIRAKELTHNYSEQEFTTRHAFLEAEGFPVFYWPYLAYPDFQVKRKTGMLAPSLSRSREMDFGVQMPFFWAMTDHQDMYISPIISATHIPLVQGQYKGVYANSKLELDLSGTQDKYTDNNEGHIKANYRWDMTDQLRLKSQYYRISDDTYLRRYPIDNVDDKAPWLQSHTMLEHFGNQTYGYARFYDFQNLRADTSDGSMPKVPQFNYSFTSKPFWKGLYSFSEIDTAGVYSDSNPDSSRFSVLQALKLPYISNWGIVVDTEASVRFDGYAVEDDAGDHKDTSRFYPNVSVEMRYPVVQQGTEYSQVLEPIIMAVWSPNSSVDETIPNSDSLDFEFDDVTLFSRNRYAGYDRVETGARFNYGLQWSVYSHHNVSMSALFGQSYRFREDPQMIGNGLNKNFSSYVGRVNMQFADVGINYRFRLNHDDLSQEMSELSFVAGRDPLRISVSYLYLTASPENIATGTLQDREEILIRGDSKLTRNWALFGYYRYDLANNGGLIEAGGGIQYENECTVITFTGEEEFTEDRNYKGDTSFFARVYFKTLGGV